MRRGLTLGIALAMSAGACTHQRGPVTPGAIAAADRVTLRDGRQLDIEHAIEPTTSEVVVHSRQHGRMKLSLDDVCETRRVSHVRGGFQGGVIGLFTGAAVGAIGGGLLAGNSGLVSREDAILSATFVLGGFGGLLGGLIGSIRGSADVHDSGCGR